MQANPTPMTGAQADRAIDLIETKLNQQSVMMALISAKYLIKTGDNRQKENVLEDINAAIRILEPDDSLIPFGPEQG